MGQVGFFKKKKKILKVLIIAKKKESFAIMWKNSNMKGNGRMTRNMVIFKSFANDFDSCKKIGKGTFFHLVKNYKYEGNWIKDNPEGLFFLSN